MKRFTKSLSIVLILLLMTAILPQGITASAATVVNEVYAMVSTPIVGHTVSRINDTHTLTEGVTITNMCWTKENGAIYPNNTVFEEGVTYYCDIEFTVKSGYTFPASYTQLKGYINEKAGEISTVYYTDHAYVTLAFKAIKEGEVYVAGVGMNDGDYLHQNAQTTTKSKPSDNYAYYNNGKLTLHNYTYEGIGVVLPGAYSYYSAAILASGQIDIVVEGRCNFIVTGHALYTEALYLKGNDTTNTISCAANSLLQISVPYTAIESSGNLIVKDSAIIINSDGDGFSVYDDLTIQNSTLSIVSDRYAIYTVGNVTVMNSTLGVAGENNSGLSVEGDIYFEQVTAYIRTKYTAINAYIDEESGNSADIIIIDSKLDLTSADSYGIYAGEDLILSNTTAEINADEDCLRSFNDLLVVNSQITAKGNDGIEAGGDNLYIVSSDVVITEAVDCGIDCRSAELLKISESNVSIIADYPIYTECDLEVLNSKLDLKADDIAIWGVKSIDISKSEVDASSVSDEVIRSSIADVAFDRDYLVQASTGTNGTLELFDMNKISTYRRLKITKKTPLAITTQPKTAYAKLGQTVKTTVKASGDGLKYTWYVKNSGSSKYVKSSITSSTYSVKMSSSTKNRRVYCVVKDMYGKTVQSESVLLREAASITTQPKTAYAKLGQTVKTTVKASGDGLKYTWYVKNSGSSKYVKSSITSSTYSVKMSSSTKNRRVYCVVKDKYGKTVQSESVLLREAVSITTQPKTVTVKKNATAKVTVKASGDGLKYTWYVKNAGAGKYTKSSITKSSYSVTMTTKVKNRSVYCVVTDKYGKTVKSNTVQLKMK